jgi:hypothetical protein
MADGPHAGDVLLPVPLHDGVLRSRRSERGLEGKKGTLYFSDVRSNLKGSLFT